MSGCDHHVERFLFPWPSSDLKQPSRRSQVPCGRFPLWHLSSSRHGLRLDKNMLRKAVPFHFAPQNAQTDNHR